MAQEATQEEGNLDLWPCTYAECRGICCDENGSYFNESRNFALRSHRDRGGSKITAHYTKVTPETALCLALQSQSGFESKRISPSLLWLKNAGNYNKIITINIIFLYLYSSSEMLFVAGVACLTSASLTKVSPRLCCFFTQARINNCQVLFKESERDDRETNEMCFVEATGTNVICCEKKST